MTVTDTNVTDLNVTEESALVSVENLSVSFGQGDPVVSGVSFELRAGGSLAIVGESGSGKSVTARALVGLAGDEARVSATTLRFGGTDLLDLREREWRQIRGKGIGFVLQDALVSLDPIRPVGKEIEESLKLHTDLNKEKRQARIIELLNMVGVPDPELRAKQLPSQLSGGLRQRALIAAGIASGPGLLIADEPTTALDVTIQAQILRLLDDLRAQGQSLLVISHDLAVVARLADHVAVMQHGRIVEYGPTAQVFADPQDDYTKQLLAAVPAEHAKGTRLSTAARDWVVPERHPIGDVVASSSGLSKSFTGPDGVSRPAVHDVSFQIRAGETLGIVGESGSGKTTTGRLVLGLDRPDKGRVEVLGRSWQEASKAQSRALHKATQVIYQDPLSSFDPRYTVERVVGEALAVAGVARGAARRKRALTLLDQVGLSSGLLSRRPLQLSGGQRQRVAIARALATDPALIVLDEPVSALDVSVQAQVLDLLADVQAETGVAYLFISHDLGVVYHVSDRVLVMKDARVVEQGDVETIFRSPSTEYTRELIAAIPRTREPQLLP